jgi:hypothetical protein
MRAKLASETDFDAIVVGEAEIDALDRKLVLATGVTAKSEERLLAARAQAAEKAADVEHAAMLKRQQMSGKRFRSLPDKFAPLLAELEWAEDEVEAFAKYNMQRGDRPFIPDPEAEVRQTPARTLPAEYEEREQWLDAHGNQPTVLRRNSEGEMVPVEPIYTKRLVRVCTRPERFQPAQMPERYAKLLPLLRKAVQQ